MAWRAEITRSRSRSQRIADAVTAAVAADSGDSRRWRVDLKAWPLLRIRCSDGSPKQTSLVFRRRRQRRLEIASPLADGRQLLGFAVAEQFGLERHFLGSHRLGRDHFGEVALGTAGLEVHVHAIRGRLRVCDDGAL
jgi:hypothetical protein